MIFTTLGQRIIVRYHRKPFGLPTAPSKLFRITDHKFYTPEEVAKIRKLHFEYRDQERLLQEYMKVQFYIPATQAGGLPKEFVELEEQEEAKIRQLNDEKNAQVAKVKEESFAKQRQDMMNRLMDEKLKREEQLLQLAQDIDDYIIEKKTDPDSFVTSDNIEALIERAMQNPISFEFAIDRSGRKLGQAKKE